MSTTTPNGKSFMADDQATHHDLLRVQDLKVEFHTRSRAVPAVDGVSFDLQPGETLAVVGESGSGKSATALAVAGLLPRPAGQILGGRIEFQGRELRSGSRRRREVLGDGIAMVFQDPMSSLNPVFTVGYQVGEALRRRRGLSRAEARKRAVELMEQVKIPAAAQRANDYPHQFSGGMRQRVMIALALALDPEVLIADEPTTALDATVQAQILQLLSELRDERRMGLILITHDLSVVAQSAHRMLVMYGGKTVETGHVADIFRGPAHPYTRGLMASVPDWRNSTERLPSIPGQPPDPQSLPTGCSFNPRCSFKQERCEVEEPALLPADEGRASACHFALEVLNSG